MSGRIWLRPLGLTLCALVAAWVLWRLGGPLPLPRKIGSAEVDRWLRTEDAPTAVFALVRALALVMALYVSAVGALGTAAGLTRAAALSRLTRRVALPSLRPLLAPIAAVTITVASALPAAAQSRGEPRPPVPVMQIVRVEAGPPPVMTLVRADLDARATVPAPPAAATHTVERGDTFWSIAEDAVRASGRPDSDADVVRYWRSLIDANRDRLRVRDEPDLIYPGQVFVLPPVS